MVTSLDTRQYSLLSMIRCWFQEENKIDLREMNQMRIIYFKVFISFFTLKRGNISSFALVSRLIYEPGIVLNSSKSNSTFWF